MLDSGIHTTWDEHGGWHMADTDIVAFPDVNI